MDKTWKPVPNRLEAERAMILLTREQLERIAEIIENSPSLEEEWSASQDDLLHQLVRYFKAKAQELLDKEE